MGQGTCGRLAAASTMCLLGLSPAFAMDRDAGGIYPGVAGSLPDSDRTAAERPCPTRFDYMVLASFADAPGSLSLSTYHFRSEVGFRTIPLGGLLRVGYTTGSGGEDCRSRAMAPRRQAG